MPTRKARFAPPARIQRRGERTFAIPVLGGVHAGLPAHELPLSAGFSPTVHNFTPDVDGWITPRSGLSKFGTYDFGGAVLGAAEVFDIEGRSCVFAPSSRSLSFLHPQNQTWSALSYVPGTVASAFTDGAVSGTSTDYFRTISIFEQSGERFIGVTSNGTNAVKFFSTSSTNAIYSDFTWLDSLDSMQKASDVASINDRLVFANLENSNGTRYPTRVLWSSRGDPLDFAIASGAGFEDLMDMRGSIQRILKFRDFLVIFTEYEIWRATPTFDDYAFRFDIIADNVGCPYPNTVVATPLGIVFMEHDREVWITDGVTVAPLGPNGLEGPSRIKTILRDDAVNLERTWATYNYTSNRYELYYVASESSQGFPTRALWLDLHKRSWWPQRFAYELSSGVDFYDVADMVTYDEVEDTYDSVSLEYDGYDVAQKNRRVNVFTSDGSALRFLSTQTNDVGRVIDARWRSAGMKDASARQKHLTEIWTEYETDFSSTASIFVGSSRDESLFDSGATVSFTTPGGIVFLPTWKTGTSPNFEIRIADGGQPRIASFSATLKDASRF